MWKSTVGHNANVNVSSGDDDWDTDADFVNNVSEKEQRWGSKTIEGSGKPAQALDMNSLRTNVTSQHAEAAKKEYQSKPGFSYGYGGKFGVQTDRMDKSAVGYEEMSGPSGTHSSIPKYEKPTIASKPADFKKKFEVAPDNSKSIEEARKARAEKDRLDRERNKAEQDAKRAKELEEARREEERQREARESAEAASRQRSEEEAARNRARYEAEEAARAAAAAEAEQQQEQEQAVAEPEVFRETEQEVYAEQVEAVAEYDSTGAAATEGGAGFTATAMYEYEATGDDELGFVEGDQITNIEVIDEGWWRGECNGRYGLFPANYVQAN